MFKLAGRSGGSRQEPSRAKRCVRGVSARAEGEGALEPSEKLSLGDGRDRCYYGLCTGSYACKKQETERQKLQVFSRNRKDDLSMKLNLSPGKDAASRTFSGLKVVFLSTPLAATLRTQKLVLSSPQVPKKLRDPHGHQNIPKGCYENTQWQFRERKYAPVNMS